MYSDQDLPFNQIFVVSAYFQLMAQTLSQMFVRGVAELAEAYISVRRLQTFLECDEVKHDRITNVESALDSDDTAISMRNVRAKWNVKKDVNLKATKFLGASEESKYSDEHAYHVLDQINVRIKKGSLVGVVGPVGSGNECHVMLLLKIYSKFCL